VPDKKQSKYFRIADKKPKFSSSSKEQTIKLDSSNQDDDKLCVISEVEEYKHNDRQSSSETQQNSTQQSDSNVKVPIFVLHPSGTHYIPMCIDASVVSHAFQNHPNLSRTSSSSSSSLPANHVQCHPVSIPVNFNSFVANSDPYELDIQNINVIGTRHQTSVQPN
jgi:hypothetical protein